MRFRKSKSIGPIKTTISRRGITTSIGGKGARVSVCSDNKIRTTSTIPNSGISNTQVIANLDTTSTITMPKKFKKKWIAFGLCLGLGFMGIHKFYEGKIGIGILYFFTGGLCGIGWIVDTIVLLTKPTEYEV